MAEYTLPDTLWFVSLKRTRKRRSCARSDDPQSGMRAKAKISSSCSLTDAKADDVRPHGDIKAQSGWAGEVQRLRKRCFFDLRNAAKPGVVE